MLINTVKMVLRRYSCVSLILLLITGCATLPAMIPIAKEEKSQAVAQFKKMIAEQGRCSCCFDADVSISFKKLIGSGILAGYLQGREPSSVRFEGVNPLGMTEIVAGVNGEDFHLLNVRGEKVYVGKTSAEKIKRYITSPSVLKYPYYWLIGRLPPGPVTILDVQRDFDSGWYYWVDIVYETDSQRVRILYDRRDGVVLQNILLEENGSVQARFVYEYDKALIPGSSGLEGVVSCRYPGKISLDENGNGTVTVSIKKSYYDVTFEAKDFDARVPNGFMREEIK